MGLEGYLRRMMYFNVKKKNRNPGSLSHKFLSSSLSSLSSITHKFLSSSLSSPSLRWLSLSHDFFTLGLSFTPLSRLAFSHKEIVDQDWKSSLLSLVKAFDFALDVYEGFCNLKQVDLKLKICRGASIKKILVWEAQSYSVATVIVGTACNHIKLWPSTLLAKYCAKKLSKDDCWVLAVNNGKVVFKREGSPTSELKIIIEMGCLE